MRLGSETGSLINHVLSTSERFQLPALGDGATLLGWSDRYPATVIEVFPVGKKWLVTVRTDHYRRTDSNGMSESQEYEYTPNPGGAKHTFRCEADGRWVEVFQGAKGRWLILKSKGISFGRREAYHDFSF